METKRSENLTFHRINRTVYVEIGKQLCYLFPLRPTDGHRVKRIWTHAENIKDYNELLSSRYCDRGERVRIYTTSMRL